MPRNRNLRIQLSVYPEESSKCVGISKTITGQPRCRNSLLQDNVTSAKKLLDAMDRAPKVKKRDLKALAELMLCRGRHQGQVREVTARWWEILEMERLKVETQESKEENEELKKEIRRLKRREERKEWERGREKKGEEEELKVSTRIIASEQEMLKSLRLKELDKPSMWQEKEKVGGKKEVGMFVSVAKRRWAGQTSNFGSVSPVKPMFGEPLSSNKPSIFGKTSMVKPTSIFREPFPSEKSSIFKSKYTFEIEKRPSLKPTPAFGSGKSTAFSPQVVGIKKKFGVDDSDEEESDAAESDAGEIDQEDDITDESKEAESDPVESESENETLESESKSESEEESEREISSDSEESEEHCQEECLGSQEQEIKVLKSKKAEKATSIKTQTTKLLSIAPAQEALAMFLELPFSQQIRPGENDEQELTLQQTLNDISVRQKTSIVDIEEETAESREQGRIWGVCKGIIPQTKRQKTTKRSEKAEKVSIESKPTVFVTSIPEKFNLEFILSSSRPKNTRRPLRHLTPDPLFTSPHSHPSFVSTNFDFEAAVPYTFNISPLAGTEHNAPPPSEAAQQREGDSHEQTVSSIALSSSSPPVEELQGKPASEILTDEARPVTSTTSSHPEPFGHALITPPSTSRKTYLSRLPRTATCRLPPSPPLSPPLNISRKPLPIVGAQSDPDTKEDGEIAAVLVYAPVEIPDEYATVDWEDGIGERRKIGFWRRVGKRIRIDGQK